MLAAMLRQTSAGGSGGGVVGGTKPPLGSRLSSSSLGSDGPDAPAADPHYIMQLVSDVRRFADVLLQLKEVFNSKGALLKVSLFSQHDPSSLRSGPADECVLKEGNL